MFAHESDRRSQRLRIRQIAPKYLRQIMSKTTPSCFAEGVFQEQLVAFTGVQLVTGIPSPSVPARLANLAEQNASYASKVIHVNHPTIAQS